MHKSLTIEPILGVPKIKHSDDLAKVIIEAIQQNEINIEKGTIICIASKVVSVAQNRFVNLESIEPGTQALKLHEKIKRKNPRVLQLILDEADNNMTNIRVSGQWIGARTKLGRVLTSAGIDSVDNSTVLLLPTDPDASAKRIGKSLKDVFGADIGVIITDSDGREDIRGATQICIGSYGVQTIRKQNDTEETVCDMLAAAAGLVMGQRGNNVPVAVIHGFDYVFDENARLADAY